MISTFPGHPDDADLKRIDRTFVGFAVEESRQSQHAADVLRGVVGAIGRDHPLHHGDKVGAALVICGPVIADQPIAMEMAGR